MNGATIFSSKGRDENGHPLAIVLTASFTDGLLSMTGRARAYESTLVLLIDGLDPVLVPVRQDGGWAVDCRVKIGSVVAIGDEDAKSGGMSSLTTIVLRIADEGEVVVG